MWFDNLILKRLLLAVASFFFSFSTVIGQGGFNIRTPIEGNTVFQSVHCLNDTTYIAAAWSRDTLTNDHLDFELVHFNAIGNWLERKSFSTPNCIVNISQDSESRLENYFVQTEQSILNGQYAHQVFYYESNLDTVQSIFVQSPFVDSVWIDSDFMNYQFSTLSKDTCLFHSIGVWKPETTGNDVCIKKFSPTGEELWTYIYATDATDACYALLPQDDGGVIAGITEGVWDGNYYGYTRFTKIDSQGNEEWVIDSKDLIPNNVYGAHCLIQDDNNLISCGSFKLVDLQGYGKSKIIKFDLAGDMIWQREYGDYTDYNVYWQKLTNVVQTCDSNYVAGGDWYTWTPTPNISNDDESHWDAYIVKLDRDNGEIIWERNFHYLDVPNDQHKMVDMKATLDGGVIFCGEARDATNTSDANYEIEYPRQQGWLVKLDECGCLVPGCDALCNYVGCGVQDTSFLPSFGSHFLIGPNPANQFINIYVGTLGSLNLESLRFTLHDLQGKLVYEFSPNQIETTYMLSTEKFSSGLYVLSLREGEKVLQQQKLVVANMI